MNQPSNGLFVTRHVSEARDYELLDELEALAGSSWWDMFTNGLAIRERRAAIRDELERRLASRHAKVSAPEKPAVQP